MRVGTQPKLSAIGFFFVAISVIGAFAVFNRNWLVSSAQDQPEELVLPVTEFNARESFTPEEKAKRAKRNKRYDHQSGEPIKEVPYPVERIWSAHWARGLPPLPFAQSDVILIGSIIGSKAYLSDDATSVYSEFSVQVQEVLKGTGLGNQISVERLGGAVIFPSGVIQKYRTSGQGMPRQGRHYVLFLKKIDGDDDFFLTTGYELRGQKTVPLDGSTQQGNEPLVFDKYKGVDVTAFLTALQNAIAQLPL